MKVLIVGFGNLGQTFARGLIHARVSRPQDLYVLTRSRPDLSELGIPEQNLSLLAWAGGPYEVVLLAVKPQDFEKVASGLNGKISPTTKVVSVMAGVTMETVARALGCPKVVRAMPNLASQVGQGMTVFTASEAVVREELLQVQNLLNTTGKSLYVAREDQIDAATAISGSGPAYVYRFMQAMVQAACGLGFSASEAELLVSQTFAGAVDLKLSLTATPEELIRRVASKGGTTEKALQILDSQGLEEIVKGAVDAAYARAKELGS